MGFPVFEIATIIFLLTVGNISLLALLLAYHGVRGHERPIRIFLIAKACQAVGWLLIDLRGFIPDVFSVFCGNIVLLTGFSLEAIAIGSVHRREPAQSVTYGVLLLFAVVALAVLGGTPSGRVVAATSATVGIYLALAFFMLHRDRSRLRTIIGGTSLSFAVLLSFRAAAAYGNSSFSVFSPALTQTLSFMPLFIFMVVGGAGFFIIIKERDDQILRESEEKYRTVAENASESIVIIQDGKYVYANKAASSMVCLPCPDDMRGREFAPFVWAEDREFVEKNYLEHIAGDIFESKYDFRVIGAGGSPRWVSLSSSSIAWNGRPAVLAVLADIDERKRQHEQIETLLKEKDLLLREVNHRVKNNLSVAVSLLSIQGSVAGKRSAEEVLRDAKARLQTMSELYTALNKKGAFAELSLRDYLTALLDEIAVLFPRDPPVRYSLDIDATVLDSDTLSIIGLIVNEILTNSLKHAFEGVSEPEVRVFSRSADGRIELVCSDNGRGLPTEAKLGASDGFGMQVIHMLARQLGAESRIERGGGTTFRFSFATKGKNRE